MNPTEYLTSETFIRLVAVVAHRLLSVGLSVYDVSQTIAETNDYEGFALTAPIVEPDTESICAHAGIRCQLSETELRDALILAQSWYAEDGPLDDPDEGETCDPFDLSTDELLHDFR